MAAIASDPYPWPFDGSLAPGNTALIVIDMQTDFCGVGGYVDKMGYDLSLTRAPIEPIRSVLSALRPKRLYDHPYAGGPSAGSFRSAGEQAVAVTAHRRRHRRSRTVRPHPDARRTWVGDHSGAGTLAR